MYKPSGIIHLTGEHDTGKTLAALGLAHPSKTAFFHDDVKKPAIDQSEFGFWCDVASQQLKTLELYKFIWQQIAKIPKSVNEAIIFDTWTEFGKSIRYYAKANPYEFREKETFAPNGTIRNMEQWGEAHKVEAKMIAKLSSRFNKVILVSHLKEQNIGGAKTGKEIPDAGKSLDRVCNMRLWLRHNQDSGVPVALVLKRIAKAQVVDSGVVPINVLPRRIKPLPEEQSIWQAVDRYWQDPVGNRKPKQDEEPNEFELSILDGILTPDQKEVWRANLEASKIQELETDQLVIETIKELSTMPPPVIKSKIKEEFGRDIPLPEILQVINE